MPEEKNEETKTEETKTEKEEHCCSVCGKPSPLTICQSCEEKIRGEALDKKTKKDHGKA